MGENMHWTTSGERRSLVRREVDSMTVRGAGDETNAQAPLNTVKSVSFSTGK